MHRVGSGAWPGRVALRVKGKRVARAVSHTAGPWLVVQLRLESELSSAEYVATSAWRDATLLICPLHPEGGCGLARHGTYVRYTPHGDAHIARYYCRAGGTTFSLLPDCFAARMPGTLSDLEAAVAAGEEGGAAAAARDHHPNRHVDKVYAERWQRRRMTLVHGCLAVVIGLLPELFAGCRPEVLSMRPALGGEALLVPLRGLCAGHLQPLAPPLGFRPPGRGVAAPDPDGVFQHKTGADPPPRGA